MATAVQQYVGTYEIDPSHSSVQFAVGHQGIATFRATFSDVEGRLTVDGDDLALEGSVRVESVSIGEPPEFREHVVRSTDFFDADTHPLITFRSTDVAFGEAGTAVVSGELEIRGISRHVSASGVHRSPRQDPFGSTRAGIELRTTVDRRRWGMNWQLPMPDGSHAVGWNVDITVVLELIKNVD
jgi:polyisoprenoid-binding protein YceI